MILLKEKFLNKLTTSSETQEKQHCLPLSTHCTTTTLIREMKVEDDPAPVKLEAVFSTQVYNSFYFNQVLNINSS